MVCECVFVCVFKRGHAERQCQFKRTGRPEREFFSAYGEELLLRAIITDQVLRHPPSLLPLTSTCVAAVIEHLWCTMLCPLAVTSIPPTPLPSHSLSSPVPKFHEDVPWGAQVNSWDSLNFQGKYSNARCSPDTAQTSKQPEVVHNFNTRSCYIPLDVIKPQNWVFHSCCEGKQVPNENKCGLILCPKSRSCARFNRDTLAPRVHW